MTQGLPPSAVAALCLLFQEGSGLGLESVLFGVHLCLSGMGCYVMAASASEPPALGQEVSHMGCGYSPRQILCLPLSSCCLLSGLRRLDPGRWADPRTCVWMPWPSSAMDAVSQQLWEPRISPYSISAPGRERGGPWAHVSKVKFRTGESQTPRGHQASRLSTDRSCCLSRLKPGTVHVRDYVRRAG